MSRWSLVQVIIHICHIIIHLCHIIIHLCHIIIHNIMSQVIRRCHSQRCENVVFLYAGVGACAHEQVIRGDVRVYVCRSLEVVNYFVINK